LFEGTPRAVPDNIVLSHVSTEKQLADIFTKPLNEFKVLQFKE
jgi:hypothetical protein